MKRHFNYTDRRLIERDCIQLAWEEPDHDNLPVSITGEIDPEMDPPLPSDAEIFLEAYSGPILMRFPCGTVSIPALPKDTRLTAFALGERPLMRVKITAADDPLKRILARADSVSPKSPAEQKAGQRSILPVERVDLGELLWRVDLEDPDQPKLQLNRNVREPRDLATMTNDGDFIGLAYPAIVREILGKLLRPDTAAEDDHPWFEFGARLAGKKKPDADDFDNTEDHFVDCETWIDDAVRGFAREFESKRAFITHKLKEHGE